MKNRSEVKDFKKPVWSQKIYLEIVELKSDMHYYPHYCNINIHSVYFALQLQNLQKYFLD